MERARWIIALALALGAPAGCGTARPTPPTSTPPRVHAPQAAEIAYPVRGSARWTIAPRSTATAGTGGRLLTYQVQVETGIAGVGTGAFAAAVTRTLGDPRGWTAGGTLRLRRVGPGQQHDFTIYLATPGTRDRLCGGGRDGYTSCRNGDRVVLNVARWAKSVPRYGAPLALYRQYMVNHEVGHRLGNGHERCPGRGRPAPVMLQQTLGLHGCVANPWPYPRGKRYAGRSGAYDDPQPPPDLGIHRPG